MKRLTLFLLILMTSVSSISFAGKTDLKPQTICPVLGGKIDKDVFADFQGQRIYFCCPGCKKPFLKEPEKYMKKFSENRILLESVQEFCPVMTGHRYPCFINKNIHTDYKGRRIYFCFETCKESFETDPEKYMKDLGAGNSGPGIQPGVKEG